MRVILFYLCCLFFAQAYAATHKIDIESDHVHFNQKKGRMVYQGNVVLKESNHLLKASFLEIYRDKQGDIEKVIAKGEKACFEKLTDLKQKKLQALAKIIEYYPKEKKAHLLENASIEEPGSLIQSESLIYEIEKEILISHRVLNKRTVVIFEDKT